jgi:hypothetical protein
MPWRKYFPGAFLAIRNAQAMRISSQKIGTMALDFRDIVARAIAHPKSESSNMSYMFIVSLLRFPPNV